VEQLRLRDQRAALQFIRDAYAIRDLDQFVAFILEALPNLVRSEVTSYNEMRPRAHQSRNWVNPASLMVPERHEAFARVIDQEPVVAHYERNPDSRLVRLSDFVSGRQLRSSAIYSEHYGPIGNIADTLPIIWGGGRNTLNAIGLLRHTVFNDRELAVVDCLRPHLIQAHANAVEFSKITRRETWLEQALHSSARALVVLKPDRAIEYAADSARAWIREYFGAASAAERLPETLDLWVRQHDSDVRQTLELPRPRDPLVVQRESRRLVLRLLSGERHLLLLLEQQGLAIEAGSLRSLGLSRRETEVLAQLANGRGRAEIARALDMSPRTVDTHLQFIFRALGVSSRSAAAAKAFQASRIGCGPTAAR
jgi:DNA-binding NarL/FixJ family response regulator